MAFCAGLCLAALISGNFARYIGAGVAGGAAISASTAFAAQFTAEWQRLSRPLRPGLDVIRGNASDRVSDEDHGLGS